MRQEREPRPGSDDALLQQAKAGDRRAFEYLVQAYQDQIYRYLLRSVLDPTVAEDLAQEAFVRAYAGLRRFRAASSFKTWLYRIARNLCIDYQRASPQRRASLPLTALRDSLPSPPDADPSGRLTRRELAEQVECAIAALPPRLRSILVLCDLEGLSYQEAAHIEHCPVGTVKSRLFTARRALRRLLEPYVEREGTPVTLQNGDR